MIVIKNPDSEIFEEAYFILKSGKSLQRTPKYTNMVAEANRILEEYHAQQKKSGRGSAKSEGFGSSADDGISGSAGASGGVIEPKPAALDSASLEAPGGSGYMNADSDGLCFSDETGRVEDFGGLSYDDIFLESSDPLSAGAGERLDCADPFHSYYHPASINSKYSAADDAIFAHGQIGSAFKLISAKNKKDRLSRGRLSGFFWGVGAMSALVILLSVLQSFW